MAIKKSDGGLTTEETVARSRQFGPNLIFKPAEISFWKIAGHEVTEPMILLLLVVGFFYSVWGKLEDAITIFVVICLLVLAEVYNEFRAKKAIASISLRQLIFIAATASLIIGTLELKKMFTLNKG